MHVENVRYRRKRLIVPKHQRGFRLPGNRVIHDFWRARDEQITPDQMSWQFRALFVGFGLRGVTGCR